MVPENSQILELSNIFRTFMKRVSQEWNKHMDSSLTISQFRMLFLLKSGEPVRVSDLAEKLCITSGAVTGAADKLIKADLVERKRAEDDRRVVHIQVTPKGMQMVESIMDKQKEVFNRIFAILPNEDIQHLKRIFTNLIEQTEHQEG